ncbi:MAG TPA: octaprenyl diphosphate synthase [Betaproteobacteria bacterium]|nr:octaprenyl diphosphate synthase [Betaproteobacteria bacterium]
MGRFSVLERVRQLTHEEMQAVDDVIRRQLHSDVVLIRQVGEYIVNSGGKRLRPLLTVLSANACGYRGAHHYDLAAVVEFIHTATLLHDDVVDASDLRRGKSTANAVFGNAASVLVGDFLYSRAFQMMVAIGNFRVMNVMADATNIIAEGEVLQLLNCHEPDTDEQRYFQVIHYKTAQLFEASARLGAILGEVSAADEQAMAAYGMHLGTAFQLIDDVLDYSGNYQETGKNVGDDLAEGKPTLPLLYAMRNGSTAQAAVIRAAIAQGGRDDIDAVMEAIQQTGALQYAHGKAEEESARARAAIAQLPHSNHKDCLLQLADFAVSRTY